MINSFFHLFLTISLFIIVLSSYGSFLNLIFFSQTNKNISTGEKILLGTIGLSFVGIIINFFYPINNYVCNLIFFIGLLIYIFFFF